MSRLVRGLFPRREPFIAVVVRFLFLVAAALVAVAGPGGGVLSAASSYPQVYRQENFLMQALLQIVAADFFGDGRIGLAVSGRNYEQREAFVHLVYWDGRDFVSVWQSENVWEEASHVAIAAGDFRGSGRPELAVLTVEKTRLYRWNGETMALAYEGPGIEPSAEIGVVRHPHHPYDLIALTRSRGVENFIPRLGLELWGWVGDDFWPLWETPTVGRVRSVAAGTRSGPQDADFVLEVGDGMGPGELQVWAWNDGAGGYEKQFAKPLRSQPAFGLTTAELDGEPVVVAADDRGYVTVHRLLGEMEMLGESVPLGWALASAAAGDFFGDGGVQVVVAGYPNRLHVVQLAE